MDRPISAIEAEVVDWLLAHPGPKEPLGPWVTAPAELRVTGGCDCGCASVDFASASGSPDERRVIREAVGRTVEGNLVTVMLWGTAAEVLELEVVGNDGTGRLPNVDSLRTWEQHGEDLLSQ